MFVISKLYDIEELIRIYTRLGHTSSSSAHESVCWFAVFEVPKAALMKLQTSKTSSYKLVNTDCSLKKSDASNFRLALEG